MLGPDVALLTSTSVRGGNAGPGMAVIVKNRFLSILMLLAQFPKVHFSRTPICCSAVGLRKLSRRLQRAPWRSRALCSRQSTHCMARLPGALFRARLDARAILSWRVRIPLARPHEWGLAKGAGRGGREGWRRRRGRRRAEERGSAQRGGRGRRAQLKRNSGRPFPDATSPRDGRSSSSINCPPRPSGPK